MSAAAVAHEAAWLSDWLSAGLGARLAPPRWSEPASAEVRAFWDAIGWAPVLAEVIADPDPAGGRREVEALLEEWRDDDEPGADVRLPAKWRLVELGGTGFLVTDETTGAADPPVLGVVDADPTLRPEWRSYLQRAAAGIVAIVARRLSTTTVVLRGDVGTAPVPTLVPALRELAPEVWWVPAALEDGAPARFAAYRRLGALVHALIDVADRIVDLPSVPAGPSFALERAQASRLTAGLRRIDVAGATVWLGEREGSALWCRADDRGCTLVAEPDTPLARRLASESAAPREPVAVDRGSAPTASDAHARLEAAAAILVELRGRGRDDVAVDDDAPTLVQAAQRMLGGLAHALPVVVPQHREANATRLREAIAGWSPQPRLPAGARLVRIEGDTIVVTDESSGASAPPLVAFERGRADPRELPTGYAELLADHALRVAFSDGAHMGWIELVAPPPSRPIDALAPWVDEVAPRIWRLARGPAAAADARTFHGYAHHDEYVAWVAGLDDVRATNAWLPRGDRVELAAFDRARAEQHGLRMLAIERPVEPLMRAAFGAGFSPPVEHHAVGRLFDAWVWMRLEPELAWVHVDPAATAAFVAAATGAGLQVVGQRTWQSLAPRAHGGVLLG